MRISSLMAVLLAVISGAAATADSKAGQFERLLKGDYAFAGEATCLVSRSGFDADGTPNDAPAPFPSVSSYSAHGIRTFNGDGTGKAVIRVVSISHPFTIPATPTTSAVFNRGAVSSLVFDSDFTYAVDDELRVTLTTVTVDGRFLSGPRTGQTVSFADFPDVKGFLSQDLRSLTLAHETPGVERHDYSNGDVDFRMCHRSRVLLERRN